MINNPRQGYYAWLKQRSHKQIGGKTPAVQRRELRIIQLRKLGLQTDLIAAELDLSVTTVAQDITNLLNEKRIRPFKHTNWSMKKRERARKKWLRAHPDYVP